MGVVGNFIGQIAQLRLQAGLGVIQKATTHATWFDQLQFLCMRAGTVFENTLTRLEREVQAVELGIALLELIDNPQALQVVLEAAKRGHAIVERILPGMAKRRVAQVVRQRNRLHQVFIEPEGTGDRAPQLRHLQRVCQPRAKQVTFVVQKHLRFVHQPTKCGAMNDAVAVALVLAARGRRLLCITTSARLRRIAGKDSKRHVDAQHKSITSRTSASGALRTAAWAGPSITTNLISPPSAFLSTRMSSR